MKAEGVPAVIERLAEAHHPLVTSTGVFTGASWKTMVRIAPVSGL
jgi:hypothetical protein